MDCLVAIFGCYGLPNDFIQEPLEMYKVAKEYVGIIYLLRDYSLVVVGPYPSAGP